MILFKNLVLSAGIVAVILNLLLPQESLPPSSGPSGKEDHNRNRDGGVLKDRDSDVEVVSREEGYGDRETKGREED